MRDPQRLRFPLGSLIEALPIPGNRRTTHREPYGFDTKDLKKAKALLEELAC